MTTDIDHGGLPAGLPLGGKAPGSTARRWWSLITGLLAAGLFAQAVFAGAMLSGMAWARAAHETGAKALVIGTLAAAVVALISLRRTVGGTRFGLSLLLLGLAVVAQMALGKAAAHGANLMWAHI